ncbi:MAG: hypothetical protein IKQ46_09445 [Bacteroidales bacterium]|jgi:hypothetical protein|nr:hypothetical protein [Bacteroidales bacterium]
MKKLLLGIIAASTLLMLASCGEGIKQRPRDNKSKNNKVQTASAVTTNSEVKERGGLKLQKNSRPEIFDRYQFAFWDSADTKAYHDKKEEHHPKIMMSTIAPDHNFSSVNKHQLAFKLGEYFASSDFEKANHRMNMVKSLLPEVAATDSTANSTNKPEKYFFKCVTSAEKNNQYGTAALMVSGYYFGKLSETLANVNSSNLPDEKTLALGIEKLDSLKSYCNEILLGESDINITAPLQKITASADSVKNIYMECISQSTDDKYARLVECIHEVENYAFRQKK